MPYLSIQTNVAIEPNQQSALLRLFSNEIATALNKPESYVMVALNANTPMSFAASEAPSAFLQLKSLGLHESQTSDLSKLLCQHIEQQLGVPSARIYIEFSASPRKMWGWDGGTF